MYCEPNFNKVRTYYMGGKPARRPYYLTDVLLKMELDAYVDQQKNKELNVTSVLTVLMGERHKESTAISSEDVTEYGDGWLVRSQKTPIIFYQIQRMNEDCSCSDRCTLCGNLCPQMFSCGCHRSNRIENSLASRRSSHPLR